MVTDKKGKIEKKFRKELKKFMKDFAKKNKTSDGGGSVSSYPVIL